MGSRHTVHEKARPRRPVRHAWIYPTPTTTEPFQGVIIETITRAGEAWTRVAYVSGTSPPTLVDTWLPSRLCVPAPGQPVERNY